MGGLIDASYKLALKLSQGDGSQIVVARDLVTATGACRSQFYHSGLKVEGRGAGVRCGWCGWG